MRLYAVRTCDVVEYIVAEDYADAERVWKIMNPELETPDSIKLVASDTCILVSKFAKFEPK